ncbi:MULTISPECIES: PHP-associated domain-containing protein [Gracilibacillus]|uniref:PHP-associated domain-containing protein n=1 Tax=Gracilibacillus TaxID=74385 RepID=UPI0006D2A628
MIIDFHSHVKISKKSSFMPEYFQEMMCEAKSNGLTALAMTEHFNTSRFYEIYDYLNHHFSYQHGYYDIEGLKLFPGIEVDVKENGHILLIGDREEILYIRRELNNHLAEDKFISFQALMDLADSKKVLKIGAHPFRDSTPLARNVGYEELTRLDALDLNGKDLFAKGVEACSTELKALADQIHLPIVGGSDTHQFLQYGCIANVFDKECHSAADLKEAIQEGNFHYSISEQLPLKVKAATLVKKYMKKTIKESLTV